MPRSCLEERSYCIFIVLTPSASNNLTGVTEITTILKTRTQQQSFEKRFLIDVHWFCNAFENVVTYPRSIINPKSITKPINNNEKQYFEIVFVGAFFNIVDISLTPIRLLFAERVVVCFVFFY